MRPSERSLQLLRSEGWQVESVEKWVPNPKHPAGGFRKDVWGFGDILGCLPGIGTALFQVTSRGALSAHWGKITTASFDGEETIAEKLKNWLECGNLCFLHSWDAPKSIKGHAEAKAQGRQKYRLLRQQVVVKDGVLVREEMPK